MKLSYIYYKYISNIKKLTLERHRWIWSENIVKTPYRFFLCGIMKRSVQTVEGRGEIAAQSFKIPIKIAKKREKCCKNLIVKFDEPNLYVRNTNIKKQKRT